MDPFVIELEDGAAAPPFHATVGSAGFDLCANLKTPVQIAFMQTKLVSVGFRIALPESVAMLILPRSGLATKAGLVVVNSPGLVDPDYRGVVHVALRNLDPIPFTVEHNMRIAQALFVPFFRPHFTTGVVGETARGGGGFGSTGH